MQGISNVIGTGWFRRMRRSTPAPVGRTLTPMSFTLLIALLLHAWAAGLPVGADAPARGLAIDPRYHGDAGTISMDLLWATHGLKWGELRILLDGRTIPYGEDALDGDAAALGLHRMCISASAGSCVPYASVSTEPVRPGQALVLTGADLSGRTVVVVDLVGNRIVDLLVIA